MKRILPFLLGLLIGVIVNKAVEWLCQPPKIKSYEEYKSKFFPDGYDKPSIFDRAIADTQPIKVEK